jgi:hypothetical protein
MTALRFSALILCSLLASATPLVAMTVYVHVQDTGTTDSIEGAYVRYIFNPGAAYADTADGFTNTSGDLTLQHDLVTGADEIPALAISRPYPNPAGPTAYFDLHGTEKASETLLFALYDLRGRLVEHGYTKDGAVALDRPLASGSYLYRLKDEGAIRAAGKLVVLDRLDKIEFKRTARAEGTKAEADPVDILIQAEGYEDYTESDELAEGNHYSTFGLIPDAGSPTSLAIKVFNISGSQQLVDGAITLSRGTYSQSESAGLDSIYNFSIPASADSVEFSVAGFVGYEGTPFSILRTDRVAARGWVADDQTPAPADSLAAEMYLEIIPELKMADSLFRGSVGFVERRYFDFTIELLTNTAESDFTIPADEYTLDRLRTAVANLLDVYVGGAVDLLPLLDATVVELPIYSGNIENIAFVYVENGPPPSNGYTDENGDGYVDYTAAHINDGNGQGNANQEIFNGVVLHDTVQHSTIPYLTSADGSISEYGIDMTHTVIKSRLWRDYRLESADPPHDLSIKVFNISGSEQMIDGDVTLTRGSYSETASAGTDSTYNFSIPASADSVEISVSGFVDYVGTPFNLLRTDRVAARGWIADDETAAPVDSLGAEMFLEIVPELRMDDPLFKESVGSVQHWHESPRIVQRTMTEESGWTSPAGIEAVQRMIDGWNRIFTVLEGGSADGLDLLEYTFEISDEAPDWGYPDPWWGRWDTYIKNDSGPANGGPEDWDGDGDNDYSFSHIRELDGDGATMDELLGPFSLYDNPNTINGAYLGDGTITQWGIDAIHTVMKSRLGRDFELP